ncbi:hypothetical protein JW823_01775 [bacterium]|nr:hypothetical protein [candidate division CSSED10-310 bacterium]
MRIWIKIIIAFTIMFCVQARAARWVFDASCIPMAGTHADWVIDAYDDAGNQSQPERYPSPDQCDIGADTDEEFWTGAYSSWGIELVRAGHWVETIPRNAPITYGDCSNSQDLSFFDVLVIPEPQIAYTTAEMDAIINFVFDGGSLFLIGNHCGSDRNNNNLDSSMIFAEMDTAGHFGIEFETYEGCVGSATPPPECDACKWNEIRNTNFVDDPDDPFFHGPFGQVEAIKFSEATHLLLHPSNNPNVKAHAWRNDSAHGLIDVTVASSVLGTGKVAAIGDTAPADDGTGDTDCFLHDSWNYPTSEDDILFMNISHWLSHPEGTPLPTRTPCPNYTPWPECHGTATPGAPTNTPAPTGTPYNVPFVDIYTNQLVYHEGDTFILTEEISNAGPGRILNYYLALEVAGLFFFAPGWTQDIDWTNLYVYQGYNNSRDVFTFTWPDAGTILGIRFWALFTDSSTNTLVGDYDMTEFSAV